MISGVFNDSFSSAFLYDVKCLDDSEYCICDGVTVCAFLFFLEFKMSVYEYREDKPIP
jgi:hypothetical protein